MALDLIITDAGRAALINAANTGTNAVTITEIGISATAVTAAPAATALPGEIKRLSSIGAAHVAADKIHISLRDDSADAYALRSFALYLGDGTLFALYGQTAAILSKTALSTALIAIDVALADVSAAAISFGATNFTDPIATTSTPGLVELATRSEAAAGVIPDRAVTPDTLAWALLRLLIGQDGSGSGLDADLLDGKQGAYYADIAARLGYDPVDKAGDIMAGPLSLPGDPTANAHAVRKSYVDALVTAAASLARLLTVDGSGSGLDADLLDGQHGAFYRDLGNALGKLPDERLSGNYSQVASLAAAGRLQGQLRHLDGYFEVLPYNESYDDGSRAHAFYDGNSRVLRLGGRDGAGALTAIALAIGGAVVWHAANDGSGSGLDADLLDGKHATAFAAAADFSTGSNARGRWWKSPDGAGGSVIEQQGRLAGRSGQGTLTLTFPIPFTDTDYDLQMTAIIPGVGDYDNYPQEVDGTRSVNGVTIFLQDPSSGASGENAGVRWRAKGY
ncbi:hypothetical protein [Novosphingobium huizhouense]|uniref:hypothetical protein n=1 Tax=Novosphingobium huizhouense TaxID=2866625 RepID=UPI001CD85884|nr:hypothetical protein [Novosphingobium huizhouense]